MAIKCFQSFLGLACAVSMSCAGRGTLQLSGNTRARGLVVSARPDPTALVVGPVLLHVYSDTSRARVYLAPATTGTDGDCATTPGIAHLLPMNTSVTIEIPTGTVACAASSEDKPFELLWHALGAPAQASTMAARGHHPAPGSNARGQ